MTRKHFELFAEYLGKGQADVHPQKELLGYVAAVQDFMDCCAVINPRFNRNRFYDKLSSYYTTKIARLSDRFTSKEGS